MKRLGMLVAWLVLACAPVHADAVAAFPAAQQEYTNRLVEAGFVHNPTGGPPAKPDLGGFVVAGEDRKFVPAVAKIDGDTVVVSSPHVKQPVAVLYAWADNPTCTLFNRAGLPASPFRTDDWPVFTTGMR